MSLRLGEQTLRVPNPPDFGKANWWMRQLQNEINTLPVFSVFSFTTPESNVTADKGVLGINQSSQGSVFWVKQTGSGDTGWVALA